MTKRRHDDKIPDCASVEITLDRLQYQLTPTIVRSVASAHRYAGAISAMRFSYYGLKRIEAEATQARIANFCTRVGHCVQRDEVAHVVAGDILPPRRRTEQDIIRRAAILVDAVAQYGERREASTPETCAAYLDLAVRGGAAGTTARLKFGGREHGRLLELHRSSVKTDPRMDKLYYWLAEDDLLSREPLLRAAVLYWALSEMQILGIARMGIDAVIAHELRAGDLDPHGLFVMTLYEHGREALALRQGANVATKAVAYRDLTGVLEHFSHHVSLALADCAACLQRHQDSDDRLPWKRLRPPDEMDRLIFEAVEKHGSATSPTVLAALPKPRPPLRTLQRRLHKLVHDGLLMKHGGRKDAFYRVAERTADGIMTIDKRSNDHDGR
jgi:hypothetical protein